MWHENEIIAIFKFYIKFHSVDELKDKKKAYNICNDLLYEYQEECRIFRVLFSEGMGELLPTFCLTHQYEINIFVQKMEKFIKGIGLNNQVTVAVLHILEALFCEKRFLYSADYILDIQRKKEEEYQNDSIEKSVEKTDDWKQIIDQSKTDIRVASWYEGNDIPFNGLKGIKKFECFLSIPFVQYKGLDMSQMEEFYCSITDEDTDIVINAPRLKRLTLCINNNIYERITPIERMIQFQKKVIDLSNLQELEELKILHSSGYSIIINGQLKKVKKIIQIYELENEFGWLKGTPFLEEYDNYYGDIEDINCLPELEYLRVLRIEHNRLKTIDNIKKYPKLKKLGVRKNEISSINDSSLGNLEQLDLRNNIIASKMQKKDFPVQEVFLTELDYTISTSELKTEFDKLFYRAYKRMKANKSFFGKKTELERFVLEANYCFEQEAKTSNTIRNELNNIEWKDAFIRYAYDHYDFLIWKNN